MNLTKLLLKCGRPWIPMVGLFAVLTQQPPAKAACCYFSAANNDVLQPAQKAFISWDEATKTETFTVQPKFEGKVADFGMVIPTPTQPKLDEMPRDFFKSLAVFTILEPVDWTKYQPVPRRMAAFGKSVAPPPAPATAEESTVKVVEAGVVGTLDYKIVTAEKADDLFDWLKANKYHYAGDEQTLKFYIDKKWFFTVMKIDTKQIRTGFFNQSFTGELTPTRFSFSSPEIVYPLYITQLSVKDSTEALFYVQAPYKVDLPKHSYQDSWQFMWQQAYDTAKPSRMTAQETAWLKFVTPHSPACLERVFTLKQKNLLPTTLEWARRLTKEDIKILSGEAKYNREAPAEDIASLQCLRGHLKSGQYITKLRKTFTRGEMDQDLVFQTAKFAGKSDSLEYTQALPTSPP